MHFLVAFAPKIHVQLEFSLVSKIDLASASRAVCAQCMQFSWDTDIRTNPALRKDKSEPKIALGKGRKYGIFCGHHIWMLPHKKYRPLSSFHYFDGASLGIPQILSRPPLTFLPLVPHFLPNNSKLGD